MKRKVFLTLLVALIVCCLMPEMVLAQTETKKEERKKPTRREKRIVSLLDEQSSQRVKKEELPKKTRVIWIQAIKEDISPADSIPFFNRNQIFVNGFFNKKKFIVEGKTLVRLDSPIEETIPAFSLLKLTDIKYGANKKEISTMHCSFSDGKILYKLSFSTRSDGSYLLNKEGSILIGKNVYNVTYASPDECLLVIFFEWYDEFEEE